MNTLTRNSLAVAITTVLSTSSVFAQELAQELSSLKLHLAGLQQRIAQLEQHTETSPLELPSVDSLQDTNATELASEDDGSASALALATADDIQGVRSELENYKYDQSRQYERQTLKVTRDSTLYGTVQIRAQAQEQLNSPNQAKSTFDIGTALIGVRGNLYKDYNEGKNLDYQLSYGYSKRNDGSNKADDNDSKDWIARAAFTLPVDYNSWLRELKLGASYIKGEARLNHLGFSTDAAQRDRLGFDMYYNHAPFGATYEYIQGKTDYIATTGLNNAKSEGHTFTAFYTVGDQFYNSIKSNAKFDDFWPKSIQGYYRFDRFNPNTQVKDYQDPVSGRVGEYDIHSLGLNLFFAQTSKLQLQLNQYLYDLETATQKDNSEVLAQFQYTF